jgi:hypothetical protein
MGVSGIAVGSDDVKDARVAMDRKSGGAKSGAEIIDARGQHGAREQPETMAQALVAASAVKADFGRRRGCFRDNRDIGSVGDESNDAAPGRRIREGAETNVTHDCRLGA